MTQYFRDSQPSWLKKYYCEMSARAISEASGKRILNSSLEANCGAAVCRFAAVTPDTDWDKLAAENGWLNSEVRVV